MSQGGSEGGGFSQGVPEGNPNGIILVWDLDQTLINGPNIENINENALTIMHEAFESPKFTANLMLTNNGNEKFITMAQIALLGKYNQMFPESKRFSLFSITYNSVTNGRVPDNTVPVAERTPGHKAKRLDDVKNMLINLGLSIDSLEPRVFFFDDLPGHVIRTQIPLENYIQITPPFNTVAADNTNYAPVRAFLAQVGASRRTRKAKAKKTKGRKKTAKKLTKKPRSK
jgi:hypothetical protein